MLSNTCAWKRRQSGHSRSVNSTTTTGASFEKFRKAIQEDSADAKYFSFEGTPAFVLGKPGKNGLEGVKIEGAQPYQVFADQINKLLDER